jgi:nucleotide-binding universal stress UspA family protein
MIRHVLCPVDFSECSRHALDHALAIAHLYGGTVTVLHVASESTGTVLFAGAPLPSSTPPSRADLVSRVEAFARGEGGVLARVDIAVVERGGAATTILDEAARLKPDLLVIGTHGRSGFDRLVLGSVAERVLRRATCPVLTVPPRVPDAVTAGPVLYGRILCGVDLSEASYAALGRALSLARESRGWLGVAHIIELLPGAEGPLPAALEPLATQWAENAQAQFAARIPHDLRYLCTVDEIIARGNPRRTLLRLADEHRADLIVIGAHGKGTLDRLLFGSTAEGVVRGARCPVLTVRG